PITGLVYAGDIALSKLRDFRAARAVLIHRCAVARHRIDACGIELRDCRDSPAGLRYGRGVAETGLLNVRVIVDTRLNYIGNVAVAKLHRLRESRIGRIV